MNSHDHPYRQFNFALHLGSGEGFTPHGGFHECSAITELLSASLRHGSADERQLTKITGMNKSTDITLKRGVISAAGLNEWLDEIRATGKAFRDIMITVQNEDPAKPPRRCKLLRARIIKHTSGPLNTKGTDVAIEELVLSFEGLELE